MSENNTGKSFFSGAFWGVIIGAIGGLLLAPQNGEETRKEVKGKINEFSEKFTETIKTVDTNTKDLQNNIKQTSIDLAQKAAVKIEEVNKLVNNKIKPNVSESSPVNNLSGAISNESDQKKKRFFKGV